MPATAESLIIPSSPQKTKLPPLAESNIRAPVGVVTPSIARTVRAAYLPPLGAHKAAIRRAHKKLREWSGRKASRVWEGGG